MCASLQAQRKRTLAQALGRLTLRHLAAAFAGWREAARRRAQQTALVCSAVNRWVWRCNSLYVLACGAACASMRWYGGLSLWGWLTNNT